MTDELFTFRNKVCLQDLFDAATDLQWDPKIFEDALSRYTALQICYTQGNRRRPWAALVSVLLLFVALLLIVLEILKVLYTEGTT